MKIISGQVCFHILLCSLILGGCAGSVTVKNQVQQDVGTVNNIEATADTLSVVHFEDQRVGFEIHEPSGEIDPGTQAKFNEAINALRSDHFSVAIELLLDVIETYPNYANPHINIALAYRQLAMDQEVQDHLLTALDLIPNHPVASNEYALLKKSQGDFQGARDIFEQALVDYPEFIPLHRNLGILCDVYFNDNSCAQEHFEYCQNLTGTNDEELSMWLTEIKLRSHE